MTGSTVTHPDSTYKQVEVPGIVVPRGIKPEVDRCFRAWCRRRGMDAPELAEGWMGKMRFGKGVE